MGKNILVAQSGGPTVAINSSLAGVIKGGMMSDEINKVYGGINGIEGIVEKKIVDLTIQCGDDANLYKLLCTPSMALGSCRLKMGTPEENPEMYDKILEVFKIYNIDIFIYIGGNDSMDTVAKVGKFCIEHNYPINVVGVPKTIDNDLVLTDHTPGFGSASKYIISCVQEVYCDTLVYDKKSVVIVEIMGRDAGWLTASSAIGKINGGVAPHLVYVPEKPFSLETFIRESKEVIEKYQNVVIAVSEGIRDENGKYYSDRTSENSNKDAFGHTTLGGASKYLESVIKNEVGCKVRSIEVSTLQRAAAHSMSKIDIEEAFLLGKDAVKFALQGKTAIMTTIERVDSEKINIEMLQDNIMEDKHYDPKISYVSVLDVANKVRHFPSEWLDENHNLTKEGVAYFLPLIQGEVVMTRKNGLQEFFEIKKEYV